MRLAKNSFDTYLFAIYSNTVKQQGSLKIVDFHLHAIYILLLGGITVEEKLHKCTAQPSQQFCNTNAPNPERERTLESEPCNPYTNSATSTLPNLCGSQIYKVTHATKIVCFCSENFRIYFIQDLSEPLHSIIKTTCEIPAEGQCSEARPPFEAGYIFSELVERNKVRRLDDSTTTGRHRTYFFCQNLKFSSLFPKEIHIDPKIDDFDQIPCLFAIRILDFR